MTEGETFGVTYAVKNIGNSTFSGGRVVIELGWPSINEKVFQPVEISMTLIPGSESTLNEGRRHLTINKPFLRLETDGLVPAMSVKT